MKFMERIKKFGLVHEKQTFDIGVSVLLVLDMQNYFLSSQSHAFIPSGPAIIPSINFLIEEFQKENRPIIFTQHINRTNQGGMMKFWWKDIIKPDSFDADIHINLNRNESSTINKERYDAFNGTELNKILKRQTWRHQGRIQVNNHLCCETTARSAFMHDYKVFFPVDTTATYNHRFHEATLLNLAHGFARVVISNDLFGN